MQLKGVDECACIYDQSKEVICLFCVGNVNLKELSIFLRGILPGFMVPRKIRILNELPKLPNGKINIQLLKEKNL